MDNDKFIDKAYYRLLKDYNYHNPKGTIVQYHEEGMDLLPHIRFRSMSMSSWLALQEYEVELLSEEETAMWILKNV